MRAVHALAEAEVERGVLARKERQSVFSRENPPDLEFILSESCLRRVIGGPSVIRELAHQFTLLQVAAPGNASPLEFAYVENYDEDSYLDDKAVLSSYVNLWSRLQAAALGPVDSRRLIGR